MRMACGSRVHETRNGDVQLRPAAQSQAAARQTTDCWPRVLAVLLLGLFLVWIVLGKVCRSGDSCSWTVGLQPTAEEAH